jgi:hypothetical protein
MLTAPAQMEPTVVWAAIRHSEPNAMQRRQSSKGADRAPRFISGRQASLSGGGNPGFGECGLAQPWQRLYH